MWAHNDSPPPGSAWFKCADGFVPYLRGAPQWEELWCQHVQKKAKQLPGISIALLELEFDCALIALDKEVFVGLVACSLTQETASADVSFLSDNSQAEVHIPGSHSCVPSEWENNS